MRTLAVNQLRGHKALCKPIHNAEFSKIESDHFTLFRISFIFTCLSNGSAPVAFIDNRREKL